MSFFRKEKCYVLERKIIEKVPADIEESDFIFPVYDTISWKLSSNTKETKFFLMETQKQFLKELKEKHQKKAFGICISSPDQAKIAADYANFLYIPAELCRQSDVLATVAQTNLPFVIEKGCFLAPNDIGRLAEKVKGCDFAIVDCGTANGYSDSVLDPRSLFLMQKNAPYFGVSLSDLFSPEGIHYSSRPSWLKNEDFVNSFIKTAKAFDVSFFVIKNYGNGKLDCQNILKEIGVS